MRPHAVSPVPADRLPGVSAEELLFVIEVHLDRVHDAVRRLGCDPLAAVEVVETSALDLVDAVAERPHAVPDAVGWWLHAARRLGARVGRTTAQVPDPLPVGGGLLSADDDQLVLSEALEELGERDRAALLLRDSYALPLTSVAVALGTDQETASELVARARLAFLSRADDEPAVPLPAHAGSLAVLARLADDGPARREDATARRHASTCAECGTVVDAQRRAHLLLAGLTVVALPAQEHAAVLRRVEDHAVAALPTTASLLVLQDDEWLDEQEPRARWFSPLLATLGVVLAVLAGIGVGVATDRLDAPGSDQLDASAGVPRVTAPPVLSPAPGSIPAPAPEPTALPRVFEIPSPTPSPPPPPPPAAPTLLVEPRSGPDGAVLTVRGTGWTPGGQVQLAYLRADGTPTGSAATASADERGVFQTTLTASDPEGAPGPHVVRADDGSASTTAPYDATG